MKKALLIGAFVLTFIIGIALSDLVLQGFNLIFGEGTFNTTDHLEKRLQQEQNEHDEKIEKSRERYEKLSDRAQKREANLNSLIKEIDTEVNAGVIKDILLTTPTSETGDKGRIFLDTNTGESLLAKTTTDDPTINKLKQSFNDKAKNILDASKGILSDKIGQLNKELVRMNSELKVKNVEVIGKLREVEKYQKKVDSMNNELTDKNNQLTEKLNEVKQYQQKVDSMNDELKVKNDQLTAKLNEVEQYKKKVDTMNQQLTDKNQELTARLNEVEKYKKELEDNKKYITDLEGIKSDLQKTVGALETKIEGGRLKVSFKGDILFQSGKHNLREEGKKLLDSVYSILEKSAQNNDIFIAGHTDNVPIRSDAKDKYDSNWTLSTYRAIEVVKYLVDRGMKPKSLTAAGYGEYKPITANDTVEGKAKNRRVELFLIPKIIKRGEK